MKENDSSSFTGGESNNYRRVDEDEMQEAMKRSIDQSYLEKARREEIDELNNRQNLFLSNMSTENDIEDKKSNNIVTFDSDDSGSIEEVTTQNDT